MFQNFTTTADPSHGPARLAALRAEMAQRGVDGFLIPRADAHQGENVAPCDERLAWLTGFTGSAGFAAVTAKKAGVFIDGRYTVQVRQQVDTKHFSPVDWPDTQAADWLLGAMTQGQTLALDPWLHTVREGLALEAALGAKGIKIRETDNLVDAIWEARPAAPAAPVRPYPEALAGRSSADKRADLAADLRARGLRAAVLSLPDSLCWLLNIRGGDIARVPVVQAFAILQDSGAVQIFAAPEKFADLSPLDPGLALLPPDQFGPALEALAGPVALDFGSAPLWVHRRLSAAGIAVQDHIDPCILPKACKSPPEIQATRAAHIRDGVAMVKFLHWLDSTDKAGLSEIAVVRALEGFRRQNNALLDISFETICGAGPNAAMAHYRVTEASDRALSQDRLLLVDSGGQYIDGTTDITRTVAIAPPLPEEVRAFTRVLQGMIAISRARFPRGVAGAHLDALARAPLWAEGRDFDHGTGHGVGVYMSVHEGPQRISRASMQPLLAGMILSNEPGHYVEGRYGIRIENLIVVQEAAPLPTSDPGRALLGFETITWCPIDRRLIDTTLLSIDERAWLDAYHAEVAAKLGDLIEGPAKTWLMAATAPL